MLARGARAAGYADNRWTAPRVAVLILKSLRCDHTSICRQSDRCRLEVLGRESRKAYTREIRQGDIWEINAAAPLDTHATVRLWTQDAFGDGDAAAFLDRRKTRFAEWAGRMKNTAQLLREQVDISAELMAQEMGKPIRDGRAEVGKCAWACDYYADHAEPFLQPEIIETDARKSFVTF